MSSSAPSATNVAYRVNFKTATTSTTEAVVVDFCSNHPIAGEACNTVKADNTTPWTLNVNEATTTINGETNIDQLTVDAASDTNTLIMSVGTPASISSGTEITFEIGNGTTNGLTNIDEVRSFYARIYLYDSLTTAQSHNEDASTGYIDYGGIALSTAAVINITARVQETLSFCVFEGGGTCGNDPSFTIGHDSGNGTLILTPSQVDVETVDFSVSTNASGGVSMRLKGDILKDSTTPTPNDINAKGTASVFTAGQEGFGLRATSAASEFTAQAPYNGSFITDAQSSQYGLVASGGGSDDITATYGGLVAIISGPVNGLTGTLNYAAQASNTTAAGVYTAAHQLIATGTF